MKKVIYHLCADIGSDSKDYQEHPDYEVRLIGKKIGIENAHPEGEVYGVIANPPCTMFSLARTTAKTPRDFQEGMFCVRHCLRFIWEANYSHLLHFWMLENPRGYLRRFLGKPASTFEHWQFKNHGIKPTDLWGYFNMPKSKILIKPDGLTDRFPNGRTNAKGWSGSSEKRSLACPGFAKAFFEANR